MARTTTWWKTKLQVQVPNQSQPHNLKLQHPQRMHLQWLIHWQPSQNTEGARARLNSKPLLRPRLLHSECNRRHSNSKMTRIMKVAFLTTMPIRKNQQYRKRMNSQYRPMPMLSNLMPMQDNLMPTLKMRITSFQKSSLPLVSLATTTATTASWWQCYRPNSIHITIRQMLLQKKIQQQTTTASNRATSLQKP